MSSHRSSNKQLYCPHPPPCRSGMTKYKMRRSLSRCCRKPFKHRIGPTYYKKNKWVKFLKSHGGKGMSRTQLKKQYRSRSK